MLSPLPHCHTHEAFPSHYVRNAHVCESAQRGKNDPYGNVLQANAQSVPTAKNKQGHVYKYPAENQ